MKLKKALLILRSFGPAAFLARSLFRAWRSLSGSGVQKLGALPAGVPFTRRAVLVVDEYVPFFDRSAGGKRIFELVKLMRGLGYAVVFASDEGKAYEPHTSCLRALGVHVICGDAVASALDQCGVAWLSRPEICAKYAPIVRDRTTLPIVFDTVDLHYRRLESGHRLHNAEPHWETMRDLEVALARTCDRTVVTTRDECDILQGLGVADVCVVPVVVEKPPGLRPGFGRRVGLLFLGNYTHSPNVDAAVWFCTEVLPRVRERLSDVSVTLAGAEPTVALRKLNRSGARITGFIPDLTPLFDAHRIFVAPLRYGAGIKGKILEALAHGVPVIATSVGTEGMGLVDGHDVLVADSADDFAAAILRLYGDPKLWHILAEGGVRAASSFGVQAVQPMLERALDFASVPVID